MRLTGQDQGTVFGAPSAPQQELRGGQVVHSAPKLVGRRSELHWLLRCLDDATSGQPQMVWLRGAAGIGKSRIARELATRATSRGVDVHYGRCQERLILPYLPFEESLFPRLRQMLETERGGPPASDVVRRVLGQLQQVPQAPTLDLLAQAEAARHEQTRLLLELTSLMMRLAQRRPALLVVDDLHWADQASFDFLVQLGLRLADARVRERIPLLLVIAARPELDERRVSALHRLEQEAICSRIDLEGLDRFETAELVRQLGVGGVTPELAESLKRATGGNPLFLENAARAVMRHAASARPESSGIEPGSLSLGQISDAIAGRLAHLGESCRHALTVGAFLGANCALDELQRLAQMSRERLTKALA